MIYLGFIAIILGIVSILITNVLMKNNKTILKQMKHIRNKCINTSKTKEENRIISLFKSLQKESGYTLDLIYNIIIKHYNKSLIIEEEEAEYTIGEEEAEYTIGEEEAEINQENFHNYPKSLSNKNKKFFYTDSTSRGYQKKVDIEKNLKKILDIGKIKELSEIVGNYRGLFDRTFERIKALTESDTFPQKSTFKGIVSNKNSTLTCSKSNLNKLENLDIPLEKLRFCQQNISGKKYCFRVPKKSLCTKGKIVKNTKNCDFY